ncbi:MAG: putative metal-binding motif-containing protein, partial [Planctomycetes bacterium]|nr:putative metal-binding motif-containing protein [Planctomycetota bacterium]
LCTFHDCIAALGTCEPDTCRLVRNTVCVQTITLTADTTCVDADRDGFGSPGATAYPKGPATDCDDTNDAIFPGAPELCDGLDNECNLAALDGSSDIRIGLG